jgi:hypothetical protein
MSVTTVGMRGWAARPWQSKASVSVQSDGLSVARMLELAAEAGRSVQDDRGWVSVRGRSATRVDLRVRDLARPDSDAVMLFHVEAAHAAGRVTARSAVDDYQVKDSGLAGLVAVAHRKVLGYPAYERYMEAFGALVVAADPGARVSFTSGR